MVKSGEIMLIGNYISKLAANGRTACPSKFRNELGDHLVLLHGYEQCLMLVKSNTISELTAQNKPFSVSAARATDRFILGNAFEIELDDQGRLIIPQTQRQYAKLNSSEVVFVGVGNRVEIWDPQVWQEYQTYLETEGSQLAEQLSKI